MKHRSALLFEKLQQLIREDGQDLVEYALIVALIAFATTTGMKSVATGVNSAFTSISTTLSTALS